MSGFALTTSGWPRRGQESETITVAPLGDHAVPVRALAVRERHPPSAVRRRCRAHLRRVPGAC